MAESDWAMVADDRAIAFDDGKAPGAFRAIGEVSRALTIAPHVLRYWEEQFPMLRPVKRSGGRRHYRPEDVVLIETIDRLVNREGYTLRGARQLLETQPQNARAIVARAAVDAAAPVTPPAAAQPDLSTRLMAIREILAQALEQPTS